MYFPLEAGPLFLPPGHAPDTNTDVHTNTNTSTSIYRYIYIERERDVFPVLCFLCLLPPGGNPEVGSGDKV